MTINVMEKQNSTKIRRILTDNLGITAQQLNDLCQWTSEQLIVSLPFHCHEVLPSICQALSALGVTAGDANDQVVFVNHVEAKKTKLPRLNNVKNMIAVASGKGGVGKSATTLNLALALSKQGANVGILDADIYGPSVPIMLGNPDAHPVSEDNRMMQPLQAHGLVANSIGYLVPPEDAAVWRGPMASKALQQIVNETLWPALDYLLVDMPPGTGDIQLTLSQQLPVTAAVIVTTPQNIALADAQKGISMFNKVGVPVLGLVENMSYYQCRQCGHIDHVFSSDGGNRLAQETGVPLLGQIPLDIAIREHADSGKSLFDSPLPCALSQSYLSLALNVAKHLAFADQFEADNSIDFIEKH